VDGGLTGAGSCTVVDEGDGTKTISCDDGTEATIVDGAEGAQGSAGTSCTIEDEGDGTKTLLCEDGTEETILDGMAGLTSLISTQAEPPGSKCPLGGQRFDIGVDDDSDGTLDDDEIDETDYLCTPCGLFGAEITKDFTTMGDSAPAALDLTEVSITASPGNLNVDDPNGLGVVGGNSDFQLDGSESVTFTFAGAAYDVRYSVVFSGNLNGQAPGAEATIEAFQGTESLGVKTVGDVGDKDVSGMYGDVPITSFVLTANVDSQRIDEMFFTMCQ
jgi:hypothetical protein